MKQKGSRRGIIYYTRVTLRILKLSFSKTHAYKTEVWANILRSLITIIPQVFAIYVLYGNNSEFAGWRIEESFLILGIFNIINYLSWSSFFVNLGRLDDKIVKGEWDFLMLKPISTIFSASFIDFFIYNLFLAVSGLGLIIYYIVKSNFVFSLTIGIQFLSVFISAIVIWYSFTLISASFSFRKSRNGLLDFTKTILNISRFPIDIWPSLVQIVFYTLIPIAFISTVPAKVLVRGFSWKEVGFSIIISFIFLIVARKIWNININKYSSTGS